MLKAPFVIALAGALAAASLSAGKLTSKRTPEQCVSQIEQSTAAIVARDWTSLERLARRYIAECAEVLPEENTASAYENLAGARMYLKRPVEALSAVEKCIDIDYANPGCHVTRVQALLVLAKREGAEREFGVASRLVDHCSDVIKKKLDTVVHPAEREKEQALLGKCEALRGLLDAIGAKEFGT